MSPFAVFLAGLRRALRAPALLGLLWLATLLPIVPPAIALQTQVESHLGESLEAERAIDNGNIDWLQEFRAQAGPLGRTLRPDVIGFAAVMDNTSALVDAGSRAAVAIVCGLAFLAAVWFLTPGLIQRLAVDAPVSAQVMLGTCGAFLSRTFRLAAISAVVYGALFASVHPWLFDELFDRATHNVTVERTAFLVRLALYLVFLLMVGAVNLLFDVTKVRLVIEDRRSVLGSMAAASRFIRANARTVVGAYLLNVVLLGAVLGAYYVVAPGAGSAGIGMWIGFALGQGYIVGRTAVKLSFWSGSIEALQRRFRGEGLVRPIVQREVVVPAPPMMASH